MSIPSEQKIQLVDSTAYEYPFLEKLIRQRIAHICILLTLVSLAVLVVYFLPPLIRSDVYTDDMRQHIAWYYAAKDPELFRNDILKTYFADTFSPIGYRTFYKTVSIFVDPQFVGELLACLLPIGVIFLSFKLGKLVTRGSYLGGITAIGVFLFGQILGLGGFVASSAGGIQRSFALPLTLLGVYAILRRDFRVLSLALVLGALFYPPTYISLGMFSALVITVELVRGRISIKNSFKDLLLLLGAAGFSLGTLLWMKYSSSSLQEWTLFSLKEALQMPEYYRGGIFPSQLFFQDWRSYISNALPDQSLFFGAVACIFFMRSPLFKLEVFLLAISGIINYIIAYLLLFKLYEPSRYTIYPTLTLWLLILPVAVLESVRFIEGMGADLLLKKAFKLILNRFVSLALVVALLIATTYLTWVRIAEGNGGFIGSAPATVYNLLKTLPKDIKIAAHPSDGDDIPMRSQRSVLVMLEAVYPYHKELYREMTDRMMAIWAAMYASNPKPILALRERYGADILVINRKLYEHDLVQGKPFDKLLERYQLQLGDKQPLVFNLPEDTILLEDQGFLIIDLNRFENQSSNKITDNFSESLDFARASRKIKAFRKIVHTKAQKYQALLNPAMKFGVSAARSAALTPNFIAQISNAKYQK